MVDLSIVFWDCLPGRVNAKTLAKHVSPTMTPGLPWAPLGSTGLSQALDLSHEASHLAVRQQARVLCTASFGLQELSDLVNIQKTMENHHAING